MSRRYMTAICLVLLGVTSALGQTSALVGTWKGSFQGIPFELTLRPNGTGEFSGDPVRWRVQGSSLILTDQDGDAEAYSFRLQGAQLLLSGGDLMGPVTMIRVGAGAVSPPSPEPVPPYGGQMPTAEPQGEETPRPAPAAPARAKKGLSEAEIIQLLEAEVPERRVLGLVEERGVSFSLTAGAVSRLKAKGASPELINAVQAAAQSAPATSVAQAQTTPARPATTTRAGVGGGEGYTNPPTSRPVAVARGPSYTHDQWGVSFAPPAGWKVAPRQGLLLLGSDTEPGLMVIRFVRRTSLQQLAQEYGEGLQEDGMQLMPATPVQPFPAGQHQGLAGELAGRGQDGAALRGRIIAVASPYGDATVVLGLTTEQKYSVLKLRVESLATTFSFSQPRTSGIMQFLAGHYWYFSSSTYGSSERKVALCNDGRFYTGSEMYSRGDAGLAAGQGGKGGTWTAEGDENRGTIFMTYDNGETAQQEYRVSHDPADQSGYGPALIIGAGKFQRTGDGNCR